MADTATSSSVVDLEEQRLAADLKQGDREAFEQLFARYWDSVYRFVFFQIRDEDSALDIAQEAFARVYEKRERITPRLGIRRLLFTVARNLCLDEAKSHRVRRTDRLSSLEERGVQFESGGGHIEEKALLQEMEQRLEQILETLPAAQREVVLLKKVGGLTYEEVADACGINVRQAKYQVKQVIEQIVKSFDQAGFTMEGKLVL